jgi:hypothetical protein
MNSSKNIRNAFMVVHKTYENVNKLMEYCKTIVAEKSNYINVIDKFLRYKSDNDYSGWYIKDFIILFQRKSDIELENEWRDGPIYVMEIELYSDNSEQIPTVYLSKFDYYEIGSWSKGCSPANHWRFYYPLRNKEIMDIQINEEMTMATPKTKELGDKYYWGLIKASYIQLPLTDINADNVEEKIFGGFDKL